ncbi:MAG: hypothetical protein ACYTGC_09795, partial [Planctomycetota bacterium]
MTDRQIRAKQIFLEMLEQPEGERSGFLEAACAGDDVLRARVESLVGANEAAGVFLSQPTLDSAETSDGTEPAPRPVLEAGSSIGPYRLIHTIGE